MPWARSLISAVVVLATAVVSLPVRASADAADLLLTDVGSGFVESAPDSGTPKVAMRHFEAPGALLDLQALAIPPDIGIDTLFRLARSAPGTGRTPVDEPSLPLAVWLVEPGTRPGDGPFEVLVFASTEAVFTASLLTDDSSTIDPVPFLLALAQRQITAAGGAPTTSAAEDGSGSGTADPELAAFLPAELPGFTEAGTFDLGEDIPSDISVDTDVARFLDDGTSTVVRLWSTPDGAVVAAVSLTKYPLELFAAATLPLASEGTSTRPLTLDGIAAVPGAIAFTGAGDRAGQVGAMLRRSRLVATVLVNASDDVSRDDLARVVTALVLRLDETLPPGASSPYTFSGATSTIAGIAISVAVVTGAVAGSVATGRLRARRLRRRLGDAEPVLPPPGTRGVIGLDADADRLRSRARMVLLGQLLFINVGVAALAGDFAWPGVVVATGALVGGLVFTTWWSRREHAILGPVAPRIDRVLPRPAGALLGLLAFAVLGFGGGFALKGLRYLVLKPTLAQLKWADFFGRSPRTVGVIFAVGGFALFVLGAALFRLARASSRSDTRRLLLADPRPPILYLRSFEDDSVLLATIVSARRPLLELFSLRGADPFEESLAAEFDTYGPVIAVGRPGRSLASLGAAREHLPDATWRDQVAERMRTARTVVVATGETDGLRWELGHIVGGGHLDKTVFVFPPLSSAELSRRWEYTAAALERAGAEVPPLPADPSGVHTVRLTASQLEVTVASRRDEATYRTAIDAVSAQDELGHGSERVG